MTTVREETAIDETISWVACCLQDNLATRLAEAHIAVEDLALPVPDGDGYHYIGDRGFIDEIISNERTNVFLYMVPNTYEIVTPRVQCSPNVYKFRQAWELEIVIGHAMIMEDLLIRDGRRLTTGDQMAIRNRRYNAGVIRTMRCDCGRDGATPYICRMDKVDEFDGTGIFRDGKPLKGYAVTTWRIEQNVRVDCTT